MYEFVFSGKNNNCTAKHQFRSNRYAKLVFRCTLYLKFKDMLTSQDQPGYLRSLQILFLSMLVGQIMIFVILWLFVVPPVRPGIYYESFDLIMAGVWFVLQASPYYIVPRLLDTARSKTDFTEKLAAYRTAQIARFGLTEASILICLIGYFFVTAYYLLLGLAALGFIRLATFMPNRNRIINELELTAKEEMMLDEAPAS